MTLRRKMSLQLSAMIVGLLLTIVVSLWGLNGLREDYGLALAGYQELRQVFEVGSHIKIAKSLLTSARPQRSAALAELQTAEAKFALVSSSNGASASSSSGQPHDRAIASIRTALAAAVQQLMRPPEQQSEQDVLASDTHAIDEALTQVGALATEARQAIEQNQQDARAKRRATMLAIGFVSAAIVLSAILLGTWQYRGVMIPLNRLRTGVRKVAAGQFSLRLTTGDGEEFDSLASDFNRMASELDGFYHQLEQKVAQKSRELVRSERLASVGFLAAGVAHEINNPLGIISGYAEYLKEQLRSKPEEGQNGDEDLARSLQVISDEAFRCKDITDKLLSLARPGEERRQPVNLAEVATQVATLVSGLRTYGGRKIQVEAISPTGKLNVMAVEAEMKQVVLNLTLNALQAVDPQSGEVKIIVQRRERIVELMVVDNGKGMGPQTLERIFEPFFTEKRGVRQAGTGLGLSITHAILENHGGFIRAQSEGLGRGSRFTVELPAIASAMELP